MSKKMERVSFRIQQFQSSIRLEGFFTTLLRTATFILKRLIPPGIWNYKPWARRKYKDLLFINGCALDHCRRYRVHHPMEQLISLGVDCDERWYESLRIEDLKYYRGFILYRTAITPLIREFIAEGKKLNKTFFFDVDDLVIDLKYTETVSYLKTLPQSELELYNSGVLRIQETLKLCDAAITSTPFLAVELKNWKKDVFVNQNVASDQMVSIAEDAFVKKVPSSTEAVTLGYLSGSISHNPDFEMIAPAIIQILEEFPNVQLKLIGLIEPPKSLHRFRDRIQTIPLMKWTLLPHTLATLDINLAPLESSLFNQAKSENRWMEAAWVRVPTIASKVGRLVEVIKNGKDGLLATNQKEDWYKAIRALVHSKEKRISIAQEAYQRVKQEYHTLSTGLSLKNFIFQHLQPNLGFIVPMTDPRGGINVIIRHAQILKKKGFDVTLFSETKQEKDIHSPQGTIPVISLRKAQISAIFDHLVGTLWSTTYKVARYRRALKKTYLVQGYETDFMPPSHPRRLKARATYQHSGFNYVTISRWCQNWLKTEYSIDAQYAPNGLDLNLFQTKPRDFLEKRWRILIEGSSIDPIKNIDESFRIIEQLPKDEFEIWYLSYDGKPKAWYRIDRLWHRIPYQEVAAIYQQCHLLIKTSLLESFSYPPLEMMATGGLVVARSNSGNREYLRHAENCMIYENQNWEAAASYIKTLRKDPELRQVLIKNGLKLAESRNWDQIENQIVDLYKGPSI